MTSHVFIRWFASALGAVTLSACVSNATVVDRKATPEQAADKAIVIVSVSQERTLSGASARFFIDGGTPDVVKIESAAGHMEIPIKNHFHDKYGHVYVLEMPPGHHRFTAWNASWRNLVTKTVNGQVPLEFDAAKGEVVYIGNLHVTWLLGTVWPFNKERPYAATVAIHDDSATDIAIAQRLNPAIAGKARVALLPLGRWGIAPPPTATDAPPAPAALTSPVP
jgi:hypothetical protein